MDDNIKPQFANSSLFHELYSVTMRRCLRQITSVGTII